MLIAEVVATTGWTWDEALDGLTTPRYLALRDHWRRRPPAHWLIASALQYKAQESPSAPRGPSIRELEATFPNGRL